MFGRIGLGELIIIFLVVLLVFGATKLPEIGKALGQAIKEFKKSAKETKEDIEGISKEGEDKKG